MRKRLTWVFAVLVIIAMLITSCFGGKQYQELDPYLPVPLPTNTPSDAVRQYQLHAGVIVANGGAAHESAIQHLKQANLVQFTADEIKLDDWLQNKSANSSYDLIVLDSSLAKLAQANQEALIEKARSFVQEGGTLFLPHEFGQIWPEDLTGIRSTTKLSTTSLDFKYPEVRYNLQALQTVWKEFAETYKQYNGLNPKFHIQHDYGVTTSTAEPIVTLDGATMLTANKVGEGTVFWSNRFMPNEQFITRLDFQPEDEQKYFHFGYATANYFFLTEIASYAAKEKFGYALANAYGPYGRPGLAWQNHYEEAYSYQLEDMIKWTDILYDNMQIPTFSLVRSSYSGGQWHTSIAWNENIGTASAPAFLGSNVHSHFTSGERMQTDKDYIQFNRYPGYNSLMSATDLPFRSYITPVDWNNDSLLDLIVGEAEGKVYWLQQKADSKGNQFEEPVLINGVSASKYAAPEAVDVDGDGLWDLIVGDENGDLTLYLNNGSIGSPQFRNGTPVKLDNGQAIKVVGPSAPRAVDWNGDGVLDLLVGDGDGFVHLYTGSAVDGKLVWADGGKLQADGKDLQTAKFAAPSAADWNGDGSLDLLVGSLDGTIRLFTGSADGKLTDSGIVQGQHYNFYENRNLIAGKNVVPVVIDWNKDGKLDLLTGQMEYGIPRPLDLGFFPYADKVLKNTQYAVEKHIPLIPHMFLSSNLTREQEVNEMNLHKEMFHNLGLEWDNDMGVNHHTWRINKDAVRTFQDQASIGIWWNFGFNPPNVSTAPRDGVEFLLGMPFDLSRQVDMKNGDGESVPFVLHVPAPHILNFSRAWEALAYFNMPLTYFEHIEHGLQKGSDIFEKHTKQINALNAFRQKHHYTFMTEQQMARSFLATFYTNVKVDNSADGMTLTPDLSNMPWQAKEYAATLGIKLSPGEKFRDQQLDTDSWYYYKDDHAYYIGLDQATTIKFVDKAAIQDRIYVSKTNSPVTIVQENDSLKVTLGTAGMQEITFHSPVKLEFSEKMDYTLVDGDEYTVIHYGDPITFNVKALK